MLRPTLLKSTTDQLLFTATRKTINNFSKYAYCSSVDKSFKYEEDQVFEAPEIFKSEIQEDIVKSKDQQEIGEKLTKKTIEEMPTDVDWPSVWPTAQTFDPNRVPLPIYQGAPVTTGRWRTRMNRWQNSELIKVPNFLHLTPAAIKRQTDAIRKFCTKWPEKLTDAKLAELYPVTIHSHDRVHASPSIRDPRARTIRLELDDHAKDKLLKLLDHRFNPKTGLITIVAEDCPFRDQNLELAIYQLTACYFEAWKTEDWEIPENEKS